MSSIESRLADMGITIPEPAAPLAAYVGHVVHNGIVTVSGQLPLVDGVLSQTGLLGAGVSERDLPLSKETLKFGRIADWQRFQRRARVWNA